MILLRQNAPFYSLFYTSRKFNKNGQTDYKLGHITAKYFKINFCHDSKILK